jgi:hypothetical protein
MESSQILTASMPRVEPQEEHRWLDRLVGEWTMEAEVGMGADRPMERWTASETVRSLSGLWVVAESESEMPGGGTGTAIMTIGGGHSLTHSRMTTWRRRRITTPFFISPDPPQEPR